MCLCVMQYDKQKHFKIKFHCGIDENRAILSGVHAYYEREERLERSTLSS